MDTSSTFITTTPQTPEPQKTPKVSFKKIIIIIFSLFISLFIFAVLTTIFIENKESQDY